MAWRSCKSRSRPARWRKKSAKFWIAPFRQIKASAPETVVRIYSGLGAGGFGGGFGGAAGVLWFAHGCDAFHVKFLVIGVARDFVDLDGLHEQDTHADMRFFVGGQPDLVVDVRLLKYKAGSFLHVGD